MRTKTALVLGKSISFFSKLFKVGGGSAAPGLYALKVDPNLVTKLARKIPKNIVITGTNGKTTTARMIAHFAKESGLEVIRNHTGSNLERGIASTLLHNSHFHLRGVKLNFDIGVWELDEAAFNTVVPKLNPDIVVFLNVSRDQLDRYGEVDKVVTDWCQTLEKLPKATTLLINEDDKGLIKLKSHFYGKILKFKLPKDVKLNGLNGSIFSLFINHHSLFINLPLPGVYHIYDAVAALSVANELNLPMDKSIQSLKTFRPAFGRVEKFTMQPSRLQTKVQGCIFLIKNPAGATAVFETINPVLKPNDRLLFGLNDNLADGTDVSWIWDAEFEKFKVQPFGWFDLAHHRFAQGKSSKCKVICSGSRAYDLANRLKYADIPAEVEPDLIKAFKDAQKGLKGRLFILPTYTAMLELQSTLTKIGIKQHYWKEES